MIASGSTFPKTGWTPFACATALGGCLTILKPGFASYVTGWQKRHLPAWSTSRSTPITAPLSGPARGTCHWSRSIRFRRGALRKRVGREASVSDRVDARMLAVMGAAFELEPDQSVHKDQHDLKELQIERTALVKDRTRLLNRHKIQTLALTRRQTKARLVQIERQLAAIEAEIETRLRHVRPRSLDILRSIPGIGPGHSRGGPDRMPRDRYFGQKTDRGPRGPRGPRRPCANETAVRAVGRQSLHQGGRKFLLHAALRFNPDMKAGYNTMRDAGKPAKVTITAVMRKLLELANALIQDHRN